MPDSTKAIINFGDLSKPITALIEKLSSGAGILYEPTRIKKQALAEAEAKKTHALADIEIKDIQKRALERFVREETIKQQNIESITEKTFEKLDDTAKPEEIEDDWISNFFDKVKFISDNEMQDLWAKLLAGESNEPGKYSKRTVELIASLDKKDAQLFNDLYTFCWFNGHEAYPLIYNKAENAIYKKQNINFSSLLHLQNIGLIQFNSTAGFKRLGFQKYFTIYYYGRIINLEFKKNTGNELNIGDVVLTKSGQELISICKSEINDDFFMFILEEWKKQGIIISEQLKKV